MQAGSFSFGISLQAFGLTPQGSSDFRIVPLPAIRFGYDFGSASEGFSLEASLFSLLFINQAGVQGFYRIPILSDSSNLYLGAGVTGFLFIPIFVDFNGGGSGFAFVHGLLGWEAPINPDYTYFLELSPGINPSSGSFAFGFSIGLRAHRTEFPTRFGSNP